METQQKFIEDLSEIESTVLYLSLQLQKGW